MKYVMLFVLLVLVSVSVQAQSNFSSDTAAVGTAWTSVYVGVANVPKLVRVWNDDASTQLWIVTSLADTSTAGKVLPVFPTSATVNEADWFAYRPAYLYVKAASGTVHKHITSQW